MTDTSETRPIAFIPARGRSARVAKKNMVSVRGRPLIAYTIEVARAAGLFEEIVVNSEDAEILETAARYGAVPDPRPVALATDEARIIHALQEFIGRRAVPAAKPIGVLLVTCPLRAPEDIRSAYDLFRANGGDGPVVSVTPYERPIHVAHVIDARNRLVAVFADAYARTTRSQEHETTYWYNGAVVFNTAGRLAGQRTLIGDEPIPYVMPFERSIDIDHGFQVGIVEHFLRERTGRAGS